MLNQSVIVWDILVRFIIKKCKYKNKADTKSQPYFWLYCYIDNTKLLYYYSDTRNRKELIYV